jgi:hypothetical protein
VIGGLLVRLGDGLGVGEGLVDDADGDFDSGGDGADGFAALTAGEDGGAFVVVDHGTAAADPAAPAGCFEAAGVGTLSTLASWGTRRKRAVWYWMATLPLPVRHGEPAGAAQVDIGQSCDSTRLKSSLATPDCFMRVFQTSSRLQQVMKHDRRRWTAGRAGVSRANHS